MFFFKKKVKPLNPLFEALGALYNFFLAYTAILSSC